MAPGRPYIRLPIVSVPCPRCGREYDVALFQFGRTFHCSCGARVAHEARVRSATPDPIPRFISDAMAGRLARWLRVIGFDTAYRPDISDAELVRQAVEERRVILTRDHSLPEEWRAPQLVLLQSEKPLAQLREVVERFGLDWRAGLFTRCSRCNGRLAPARRAEVESQAPPRVLADHERFTRCTACGRLYWEGSHTVRMRRTLARALDPGGKEAPGAVTMPTAGGGGDARWEDEA